MFNFEREVIARHKCKAVGNAIGSIVGGVTGTNQAAEAAERGQIRGQQQQMKMFNEAKKLNEPFLQAGMSALPNYVDAIMNPQSREQMMADYGKSGEFAMLQDAANRNAQYAANAGGYGGSTLSNDLARIAPNLLMQGANNMYAQNIDKMNQLGGLVGMGQNAANMQGNQGLQLGNSLAQSMNNIGMIQANKATAPMESALNIANTVAGFYNPTPKKAAF